MKLYLSDISLFSDAFFEKADFVPPQKKKELSSYAHTVSKKEHILAWSMLSFACKAETGKPVSQIRLTFSAKGKPYLAGNPFYFSLSHSDGKVLCAVSENELGADIQLVRPVKDGVVKRVLCESERQIYEKSENKPQCFASFWTQKESYLKYTGEGIAAGLGTLDFSAVSGKDSFFLYEKQFITFVDGSFVCSVCGCDEKNDGIRLTEGDWSPLLK